MFSPSLSILGSPDLPKKTGLDFDLNLEGKSYLIAELHKTDLHILSYSKKEKTFYSQNNTILTAS